jgi:hypothetical protein
MPFGNSDGDSKCYNIGVNARVTNDEYVRAKRLAKSVTDANAAPAMRRRPERWMGRAMRFADREISRYSYAHGTCISGR